MNINSSDIKVFPSTNRNNKTDSIYLTEENIISLVNRFTGGNSFVIDGLQLSEDGTTLSSGSCCINGYYFKILNDVAITDTVQNTVKFFYAQISTIKQKVSESETFVELKGQDTNGQDSSYTGLTFTFSENQPEIKDNTYNLILATRKDVNNNCYYFQHGNICLNFINAHYKKHSSGHCRGAGSIPSPTQ